MESYRDREYDAPKISVISGAYNIGSCYSFSRSMNSVLQQTFRNFEFIICDDGSTDNTWRLLSEFAKTDRRIKLLRNRTNAGLAAALNRCIDFSSGEYIARHDCDDYNDPFRFEKQELYFRNHRKISVLGSWVYLFDESGVWGSEKFPEKVQNKDFLFTSPYKHGAVMFRKESLCRAGGYRVAKETRRAEDYDLFMRMQTFCEGANLPEYLYYYCEDLAARKRRKYRYRLDEARVRYRGFKRLGLLPRGIPYVIKPVFVGLIPCAALKRLRSVHRNRSGKRNGSG